LILATACSGTPNTPAAGGTPSAAATPAATSAAATDTSSQTAATPQPAGAAQASPGQDANAAATPASTGAPAAPAPTPAPGQQQAGGMHSALPLQGEFAVTANQDDHSLSVVPIGAAAVATTVQLDLAPGSVGAAPNSDMVLAADSAPSSSNLAVASLNNSAQNGTIDGGSPTGALGTPPLSGSNGQLLIVSDADNTIRPVDPSSKTVGPPVQLAAGPHAVSFARGS